MKHDWVYVAMLEVFKFIVLCLISIFATTIAASWLYTCVFFLVLFAFFYDFDFTIGLEQHAVTKGKYYYLKVRNLYNFISQSSEHVSNFSKLKMNSVNKHSSSFDLSRFNKGSVSPIANSVNSLTLSTKKWLQPRQTSTPLTKTSPWQKNSISPTNHSRSTMQASVSNNSKYSLSTVSVMPKSNETPKKSTIQTVTGPLLASTRFNVNLGTYTETKSPGLTSRVVQYNNELSEKQTSTHQAKYGSPGVFPIVQLYKRQLPVAPKNSRRCTVRIAPPDPSPYSVDQANTILRESFVQSNHDNLQCETEINTKSVLEALKEISRKRIHSNDEEMSDDATKRQRKGSLSSSGTNDVINKDGKRARELTPPQNKDSNSPSTNVDPKRICVVNEIEGSLSSSRHMRMQQGQKRKANIRANSPVNINKQRRLSNGDLVSKQTQTNLTNGLDVVSEPKQKPIPKKKEQKSTGSKKSTAAQTEKPLTDLQQLFQAAHRRRKTYEEKAISDIDEENSTIPFCKPLDKPAPAHFSEKPLEIMRQNKLELILAAIGGHEPKLIPLPRPTLTEMKEALDKEKQEQEAQELTSILSPKNKPKHDKHVTFAMAEENSTDASKKSTGNEQNSTSEAPKTTETSPPVNNFSFGSNSSPAPPAMSFITPVSTTASTGFNLNSMVTSSSEPPKINPPSFGAITTTTAANVTISSPVEKASSVPVLQFGTPTLNFSSPKTTTEPQNAVQSNTTTTPAPLAFGFNTPTTEPAKPPANNLPVPSFLFGNDKPVSTQNGFTPAVTSAPTLSAFSTPNPSTTSTNFIVPTLSSGTTQNAAASASPAAGLFSFGAKPDVKTTTTAATPNFFTPPVSTTANTAQTPPKMGGFKFDLSKPAGTETPPKTTAASTSLFGEASKSSGFTFGGVATTTAPGTFNQNSAAVAVTSTSAFAGASSSTGAGTGGSIVFGTPSTSSTANPVFGGNASGSIFGTPTTTSSTPVFGIATTTTVATPTFGAGSSSSGIFGTPTTTVSGSLFGGTPTTTTASTNVFGASTTTTPMFGATTTATTTSASGFGSGTTFGLTKPAENSGFGGFNATPVTTAATFGAFSTPTTTQNTSTFGTFGATPSAQTSAFGTPTTTAPFTFNANNTQPKSFVTTTASTMFGSNTPTASGSVFGGTGNTAFGATTTNSFTATTTTASGFTQPTPNFFGTNQTAFGGNTSTPVFGASTSNNNNTNNNNAFGTPAATPSFGATNQGAFGASSSGTNQTNVFGNQSAQQQSSGFGATATPTFGGFGATNSTPAATGGFGASNAATPAATGGFNSFGQTGTAAPGTGVFAFGVSNQGTASTSGTGAFQFGASSQPAKPSGFNFSASGTTPNLNFGAGTNSSFSAGAAPVFGTGTTPQFNATAPVAGGMFNIGSGSTQPKQRPIMRARRRT